MPADQSKGYISLLLSFAKIQNPVPMGIFVKYGIKSYLLEGINHLRKKILWNYFLTLIRKNFLYKILKITQFQKLI